MANDRLYMRCRTCGEAKMLAKYYPGPHSLEIWDSDAMSKWMSDHLECNSGVWCHATMNGDRCFDLFTESDDRFLELMAATPLSIA